MDYRVTLKNIGDGVHKVHRYLKASDLLRGHMGSVMCSDGTDAFLHCGNKPSG